MPDTEWLDDNIELYAADVLTADEEIRVEGEMADLAAGERTEFEGRVDEIRSVLTEYAVSFGLDAPPELRARVLDQVSPGNVVPIDRRVSRSRRIGLALVAAAAVVVALGAGVLIGRSAAPAPTPPSAAQQQRDQIADVLAASDASLSVGQLEGDRGVISVVSSRQRNEAVAQLGQRGTIPADRQYQLWLVGKSAQPVSAGLVPVTGSGTPQLVTDVGASKVLAVTLEPMGGSAQPTTPILVQVPLTA